MSSPNTPSTSSRSSSTASRRLKLAADAANGMGTLYQPILEHLNLEVFPLYFELDGNFPNHEANPLKAENLVDVEKAVKEHGCDFGVAFDGDADRAIIIDEKGNAISADMITGLLAPRFLRDDPGAAIVYDLRSSWSTKEAIEEAGGVARSASGSGTRSSRPPCASTTRPSAASSPATSTTAATTPPIRPSAPSSRFSTTCARPASRCPSWWRRCKRYFATGEINFKVEDKDGMIRRLAKVFADGEIDYLDGITAQFDDWWFNVRPSNTEPYLRLVLEARTPRADGGEARASSQLSRHSGGLIALTAILGISAYYHDSAAALVVDGKIVAAAQEERFTRIKHDHGFPSHAIAYCLAEAGLSARDLDYVGFYDKPFLKFERLLETYLAFAPVGFPVVPQGHAAVAQPEAPPAAGDPP